MKSILVLAAMLAAAGQAGPTAAQFNAALAAACPEHKPVTRNIACTQPEPSSIQFSCRYEYQGADGRWTAQEAILQLAEGEWVWIDGPTRCTDDQATDLN